MRHILQVRSLRQLTLGSYILALVPLAALFWQSQRALNDMSSMTALETRFAVNSVSMMSSLERMSTDLERRLRQFFVLKNADLKILVDSSIDDVNAQLKDFCALVEQPSSCQRFADKLHALSDYTQINDQILLDARLAELRLSLVALRDSVDDILDLRVSRQQTYLSKVQRTQAWSSAILVSLSLVLLLYGSQLIVQPVNKLKRMIRAIATNQSALPDISESGPKELIALERDLHWLFERLQKLEQLRSVMLRHASHELKTPLASMLEGCSLLQEEVVGPLTEQQKEVMALLNSSSKRLNLLMEQLLDYNVLLQQAKPNFTLTSAQHIIDECLNDNGLILQQQGGHINVQIEYDQIKVDTALFRRILDNLVSNAVAHGAKDRPIDIKLFRVNDQLVLEVANRGKKIASSQRIELFEPFKRGAEERNDNVMGVGLGLSIVADCARMMHGHVECVDVDYADVCFRVTLPQAQVIN